MHSGFNTHHHFVPCIFLFSLIDSDLLALNFTRLGRDLLFICGVICLLLLLWERPSNFKAVQDQIPHFGCSDSLLITMSVYWESVVISSLFVMMALPEAAGERG